MSEKIQRKVSSKLVKKNAPPEIPSMDDKIFKSLLGFFPKEIKQEFIKFVTHKSDNQILSELATKDEPKIKNKNKQKPNEISSENTELKTIPITELTSHGHPDLFSSSRSGLSFQFNPESIDVNTYTLMRRDNQVSTGLAVIKLPIISLDWSVECEDEELKEIVSWVFTKIWNKLVRTSLMAVDYGFATHEIVWERSNVKISKTNKEKKEKVYHNGDLAYFKKIKPHHPESIKMAFDEKQNLIKIAQDPSGFFNKTEIELPIRKCFIFTNDEEFGNPFGVSRLKNAYKIWYWKELLCQFMMQYFERRGIPSTIATAPLGRSLDSSGSEVDNLEMALRLASSLISTSVVALPYQPLKDSDKNAWGLEFLNDDARAPMFIEALAYLDARILRSLFVPESIWSSGEGSGGYSGSSIHADLFLMVEKGLIADLERSINEQLVRQFIEVNFPKKKHISCLVKFSPLDWNRKITLKEIFMEMIRNVDTMVQMGVPPNIIPSLEKLADILDIPVDTFKEATGLDPEEIFDAVHPPNSISDPNLPTETNIEKNSDSIKDKDGKLIKQKPSTSNQTKLKGRQDTRRTSVSQEQDRKKINPGGKRAERIRTPDPNKKQ